MNSQLNSQPTNWGIDYSQNKVGQIYGNAIANLGQQTGNVIMEFAKKQREDMEKKQKREAVKMMLVKNGMSEADAEKMSKGINVDEVLKAQQIDNDKKQMEAQMEAAKARVIQAQTEAAQEKAKADAAIKDAAVTRSVLTGGSAPGTPPPMLARNGTPQADMTAMGYMRRMAQAGATPDTIREMGGAIDKAQGAPEAKMKVHDVNGRKVTTFGNSIVPDAKQENVGSRPDIGAKRTRTLPGIGTFEEEWDGKEWVESKTKEPIYIKDTGLFGSGARTLNPIFNPQQPTTAPNPTSRFKIVEIK